MGALPAPEITAGLDGGGLADPKKVRERITEIQWYHSIEIAPGIVTPGWPPDAVSALRI